MNKQLISGLNQLWVFFALLVTLVSTGCDKVEPPFTQDIATADTTKKADSTVVKRNVLIEDYTGHYCGNCPEAAEELHHIDSLKKGRVIPLAVHAGYFSNVFLPNYPDDFRSSVATDLDQFFGISAAGNPNGMVNRKGYSNLSHIKYHTNWAAAADSILALPADATISLTANYNSGTRQLSVDTRVKFLNDLTIATGKKFKVCIYLAEDSIVGAQKDDAKNPELVPNYVFRHMLRASLNSSFGEEIAGETVAKNEEKTKSYANYPLASAWNDKQVYVIAFVYRDDTYEILQVEQKKIR